MAFATDEEIKMAHEVLLKGKDPFDEIVVAMFRPAQEAARRQPC